MIEPCKVGLDPRPAFKDAILDAMLLHPVLVNRPFVCSPRGVRLCRPIEAVLDLLDTLPPGPLFKDDGAMIIDANGQKIAG